jgi:DNA (cytosine-5)-methyltransferase 1
MNTLLDFGSICSGIEAASVAWEPLGWRASWFSEIDPFANSVLAHHFPDTPNHGDMTTLPERIRSGEVKAPSLLCGGTPCQAFSVAGNRESLGDARGNLSLVFCGVANAIDDVRQQRSEPEAIIVWENVPGVLSTKDNAFGCFLAELAGEDSPLQPAGKRWSDAGCVYGPKRTVAWRILDAQYFGLAQRRKRVFVVASARNDFDPCAVLFEFDGVRRDSAPSREAREEVAGTFEARTGAGGFPGTDGACSNHVVPGCWWDGGQISQTLDAVLYKGQTMPEKNRFPAVLQPVAITQFGETAGTLTARHDSSPCHDRGMNVVAFHPTQDPISSTDGSTHALGCGSSGGQASVAVAVSLRGREGGGTAELGDDLQNCLRASGGGGDKPHVLTGIAYPLDLRNALRDPEKYDEQNRQGVGTGDDGDPAPTLTKAHVHGVATAMQVRRLTARECERLQGFPDNWTLVPHGTNRAKDFREWLEYLRLRIGGLTEKEARTLAADGPRYKAIGNSWAVNVAHWLGARIDKHLQEVGLEKQQ